MPYSTKKEDVPGNGQGNSLKNGLRLGEGGLPAQYRLNQERLDRTFEKRVKGMGEFYSKNRGGGQVDSKN